MIQTEPYACDFGGKGNWSDGEKYFQVLSKKALLILIEYFRIQSVKYTP
jgi:hypothetical protein